MLRNKEEYHIKRRRKGCIVLIVFIIIIVIGLGFLIFKYNKTIVNIFRAITKQSTTVSGTINLSDHIQINGSIYFVKDSNLWKISGSSLTQITNNGNVDEASVSQDGANAVYSKIDQNLANIYELNLTNNTTTALTKQANTYNLDNYLWYVDPTFSSDGKMVTLLSDKAKFSVGNNDLSVYTMFLSTPKALAQITQGYPYTGGDGDPIFYPLDNTYIVYVKYVYNDDQPQPYSEMHIVNTRTKVSYFLSPTSSGVLQPSFSADGKYIVFTQRDSNDAVTNKNTSVYIMPFNITNLSLPNPQQAFSNDYQAKILIDQGLDEMPVFSPGSNQVSFIKEENNTFDLYRKNISFIPNTTGGVSIKSSDLEQITNNSGISAISRISWVSN